MNGFGDIFDDANAGHVDGEEVDFGDGEGAGEFGEGGGEEGTEVGRVVTVVSGGVIMVRTFVVGAVI